MDAVREFAERFGEAETAQLRIDPTRSPRRPACSSPRCARRLRGRGGQIAAVARAELERFERSSSAELAQGQRIEVLASPVAAAGIYAPGSRGASPSSVLMCCVPAYVAGVPRIAVATPPASGGQAERRGPRRLRDRRSR